MGLSKVLLGSRGKKVGWLAFLMLTVDLGALLIGLWLSTLSRFGRAPLAGAIGVISMSTFVLLLLLGHYAKTGKGGFDKGSIRLAIAGSFVVVYFAVLSLFAFLEYEPTAFAEKIADDMTIQVGVIVAFYFATETGLEYLKVRYGDSSDEGEAEDPGEGGISGGKPQA